MRDADGGPASFFRTALVVFLPPGLVATLWVIARLHASNAPPAMLPPIPLPTSHLLTDAETDPADAYQARADLRGGGDDLSP